MGVVGSWGLVAVAAPGRPRSPVPWSCVGSGGLGGRGPADTRAGSPPRGLIGIRGGGGSGASAGCELTSRVGRGRGRCSWTLVQFWSGWGWSVGLGCGL